MSELFDPTLQAVARGLDLRARRQAVLASNIANLDTPNYVPKDLDFKDALRDATASLSSSPLRRTEPGHLRGDEAAHGEEPEVVERPDHPAGPDGNAVDLDRQLKEATLNSAQYAALSRAARKKIATLKYVLQG